MTQENEEATGFDLATIRERLEGRAGRDWWRSLEELADTEEFRSFVAAEFPHAFEGLDALSRRRFLQVMGASFALAGASACTKQPREAIVPYVEQPAEIVPGKPLFFATAVLRGGFATGVLVESHEGRPTKIEGNPDHPASLGAADPQTQSEILALYDPDRSRVVTDRGRIRPWSAFVERMRSALQAQDETDGSGLRILTRTVTSPTIGRQLAALLERYPAARWHQYDPVSRDFARDGARMAFGEALDVRHRFDEADVVLSLDADFLGSGPAALRSTRDFSRRRRGREMNRLYVVESTPTITGGKADHRLPVRAAAVESLARAVARSLGLEVAEGANPSVAPAWVEAVARDLDRHRGRSIVLAGDGQPPVVHAIAHAINAELGNIGRTVDLIDPVEVAPVHQMESLLELVHDLDAGRVNLLLILGGNPAYDAPADVEFGKRIDNVALRVHVGLYANETAGRCHWHVPEAHALESWGDARAFDGTATILQPIIEPLYEGRTHAEVLGVLLGEAGSDSREIVRETWRRELGSGDFEPFWRRALHDGLVPGTARRPRSVRLARAWMGQAPVERREQGIEIQFRPDPTVHDGTYANLGWLQELPKPLTKLTWDNAVFVSVGTAANLGLVTGDVLELRYEGRSVEGPAWILPGQPERSITVHLGYGRLRAGKVGTGIGFDAGALRTSAAPWIGSGVELRKTGRTMRFATTQEHHGMEGRHLVRSATLEHFEEHPEFAQHMTHVPAPDQTLYAPFPYEGYKWGMTIDLSTCTGCSACVTACQAENNVAVVGKDQVMRGREMHWIRVDRYYKGGLDNPETVMQPIPCMHCENAPCEVVCPVGATVHSSEGLNDMVYNRCVGTRYCSNNCPYKVRRFNFYLYSDWETPSLKLGRNPDVTIRSRGVMEKCTYCVQRINAVRIDASIESRRIRDGEVVTACQQACPAEAIDFGDLNDSDSTVARRKADPRNYGILEELNTRPRTSYLALIRNPNPELEKERADSRHG